mgnify:CR=1 FL=1
MWIGARDLRLASPSVWLHLEPNYKPYGSKNRAYVVPKNPLIYGSEATAMGANHSENMVVSVFLSLC